MKRYFIIYNKRLGKYFEQDFGGWSFQSDQKIAYKFKSKEAADNIIKWLEKWLEQENDYEIKEVLQ